jgi:RNA polymerase sigma factor (sigma-70 family)
MNEDRVMMDYRVNVKVRNNRILKAIESAGGEPGRKWCEQNGLSYSGINDLINLTASPIDHATGKLRSIAMKLCDAVDKIPDDLWTNEMLYPLERNFSELEMSQHQVQELIGIQDGDAQFSSVLSVERRNIVAESLATLSPRYEKVLRMRFFKEMTYQEIGDAMDVSMELARIMERRAIERLRNTIPCGKLIDCSEGIRALAEEGEVIEDCGVVD